MQAVLEIREGADHCQEIPGPVLIAVPARRSSSLPLFAKCPNEMRLIYEANFGKRILAGKSFSPYFSHAQHKLRTPDFTEKFFLEQKLSTVFQNDAGAAS
ncbi:hypothetical protein [Phyllobacterium phragmitis]|nr:hypothetical protein [Phyllobacterium phragmitis]